MTGVGKPSLLRTGLLVAGIVIAGANLRAALTSVGPLTGQIQADTGISDGAAGLLTTLPLICFAALSLFAPALAHRFGTRRVLTGGLILLAAGIALRSAPPVAALFAGTVVLGLAIAVGNVLLPSLVERDFPAHAGLLTGVYITVMNSGAALGSGVGVPLARLEDFGWRGALGVWAPLALVAAVVWLCLLRGDRPEGSLTRRSHALTPRGAPLRRPVEIPARLAGHAVHGAAVARVLRQHRLAARGPTGGRPERGPGGMDRLAHAVCRHPGVAVRADTRRTPPFSTRLPRGGGPPERRGHPGTPAPGRHGNRALGVASGARAGGEHQPGAHPVRAAHGRRQGGRRALWHGPVGRVPLGRVRSLPLRRPPRSDAVVEPAPLAMLFAVAVGVLFAGLGAGRDAYVTPERRSS